MLVLLIFVVVVSQNFNGWEAKPTVANGDQGAEIITYKKSESPFCASSKATKSAMQLNPPCIHLFLGHDRFIARTKHNPLHLASFIYRHT